MSDNSVNEQVINQNDDTANQKILVRASFEQLDPDSSYSGHEEGVSDYWKTINLPQLLKRMGGKPFNFMDGPPFVSGNLHYGHIAVGSYKSAVCNVAKMFGLDSSYVLGFDCHGLPIESKVMKVHDLSREDVEEMGLANFNGLCDEMITSVSESWRPLFEKFGRVADFDSPYMTRDLNFMESTIWVFKQLYEKGLVYSGNKVMPYSHALETPLSNFEAGQNYQDVKTKSIYVRFEVQTDLSAIGLENGDNTKTYFVAWTTTPWTLPSNLALCVNADAQYVCVEDLDDANTHYILSKNSIANLYGKKRVKNVKILADFTGSALEGMHYVPLFPYMADLNAEMGVDNSNFFRVLCDPYVRDEGIGTAIVHQAPAFGEDDFKVCERYEMVDNVVISKYCPIDSKCRYTEVIGDYAGTFVLDADDQIRADLQTRNVVVKVQEYTHSYPHCYRTDTPLIYRTVSSFFINIQPLKERMLELNSTVTWYPPEVGANRFHNWLKNSKDWAISRFRYYGTPIPIWINTEDPTDMICVGSIDELAELTGVDRETITDLHPQFVNEMKIEKDGKTYERVPDIFDCWFESGSVPFGQIHYPFDAEKASLLEGREFASDFICEGLDQTRGWFYTLLVLSTAILDKAPYKHVICTGMVMDERGQKLSKRLKNFEDPNVVLSEFGADFVRIYFVRSPLMRAEPLNFNTADIQRLKNRFVPYVNSFKFLIEHSLNYMRTNNVQVKWGSAYQELDMGMEKHVMDRWLLNRTIQICQEVTGHAKNYRMGHAIDVLVESIDELTNWYLKLNRDRLKGTEGNFEQESSLSTLYTVLVTFTQLWAPFMPFMSEYLFQRLRMIHVDGHIATSQSVLLTRFPTFIGTQVDLQILKQMRDLQRVSQMVRSIRSRSKNHTSRMVPFQVCTISHADQEYLKGLEKVIHTVKSELNVDRFEFQTLEQNIDLMVRINQREMGREYRAGSKKIQAKLEEMGTEVFYSLYSGQTTQLVVNIGDEANPNPIEFEYPSQYFTLVPTPKAVEGEDNYTVIDTDLMVRVDPTYNHEINHVFNSRLLHSAIQQGRKTMGLRPWQSVTVMIDNRFVVGSPGDPIAYLKESLPSQTTELRRATFGPEDLENYALGECKELNMSRILVDRFEWNLVDDAGEPAETIEGYFGIHFLDG